jgi:hypothetical protein
VACHPKSHAEQLKKPRSLSYQPVLHAIGSQLVNCHDGLVLEKLYARVANMHFMRCGEWSGVEGCGVVGLSKIGSTHWQKTFMCRSVVWISQSWDEHAPGFCQRT